MKRLIITLALLTSACATTKEIVKTLADIGKICAEDGIISKASQIVPAFLAFLTMPSDSWKDQAGMYAKAYGKDVAICAARNALEKLTAPVQSEGLAADPEEIKRTATARVRTLELEAGYLSE